MPYQRLRGESTANYITITWCVRRLNELMQLAPQSIVAAANH